MNEIINYLKGINKLEKDNYEYMVQKFGETNTNNFLNTIIESIKNNDSIEETDKEEMLVKFDYYINKDHEIDFIDANRILAEFNDNTINNDKDDDMLDNDNNKSMKDSFSLYLNQIGSFDLLSLDEEKKYGSDLKLINNIDILVNKKIDDREIFMLDFGKIFASIDNFQDKKYVMDKLYSYYNCIDNNKIPIYYLNEYNKLSKDSIPSNEELNEYFSNHNLYGVFDKVENKNKLNSEELRRQVNDSVTYLNARDKMIKHNLRLVVSVAKRCKSSGMDMIDLISEGNYGLIKAVEKYDVDKGYKFSTYAVWWIKQAIVRGMMDKSNTIRIPVHLYEKFVKFRKQQEDLVMKYGRQLSLSELSTELNLSIDEVNTYLSISGGVVSLDNYVGEEQDATLSDFVPDVSVDVESQTLKTVIYNDVLSSVFEGLNEREVKILKLRSGIGVLEAKTLDEIGKEFGVTRERIRQIEAKALRKARARVRSKKYDEDILNF